MGKIVGGNFRQTRLPESALHHRVPYCAAFLSLSGTLNPPRTVLLFDSVRHPRCARAKLAMKSPSCALPLLCALVPCFSLLARQSSVRPPSLVTPTGAITMADSIGSQFRAL